MPTSAIDSLIFRDIFASARSIPPIASGETLLQTRRRSQPSSCITSNFRSARANTLLRCGSGIPSKSRNGWKAIVRSPRSSIIQRISAGVPPSVCFKVDDAGGDFETAFASLVPLHVGALIVGERWRRVPTIRKSCDASELAMSFALPPLPPHPRCRRRPAVLQLWHFLP
jgi:hypothetical protein